MRVRNMADRLRNLVIADPAETDQYGEMMLNYFRTEKAKFPIADYQGISRPEWAARRRELMRKLAAAIGPFPTKRTPLQAKIAWKRERDGFTVEGISFFSRPKWPVSALFYVPKKAARPLPAVLLVHGHAWVQKAAADYQKVAITLVRNGYAVLAVDFVGGGERAGQGHEALYMLAAGVSVQGLMVWDNIRAVDYLMTRREIDRARIGIVGQSGGGNQTVYTTIFEPRIAAACPVEAVCMFDEHEARGIDNFCPCEVIPGIWSFAEYSDLISLIAPRPLLVSSAVKDRLFPIKGAREAVNRAGVVYRALGAAEEIAEFEDYGGHDFSSNICAAVAAFFDEHLKGVGAKPFEEYQDFPTVEEEASEALWAFPGGRLPAGSLKVSDIYAEACEGLPEIKRPKRRAHVRAYKAKVKAAIRPHVLPAGKARPRIEWHPAFETSWARMTPVTISGGDGIILTSALIEPLDGRASRVVILAHPAGKVFDASLNTTEALVRGGAAVLAVDLRGLGETEGFRPGESAPFTLHRSIMFGRHISYQRAEDFINCVEAVKRIERLTRLPISIVGFEDLAQAALFAFAVDARIQRLAAVNLLLTLRSKGGFVQADTQFPPGLLLDADIPDVIAAGQARSVLLVRPELPSSRNVSRREITKTLKPATDAARIEGVKAVEVAAGGHIETDAAMVRFLLK